MNNIEFAKVFQNELDKQVIEGATSGWMEENAGQVIYNGGKEIKIPTISLQGLGDYDRTDGYSDGAVTFSYKTVTMSKDRGRRFRLDAMDVNESAFNLTAAAVASEFQRLHVIPEIDAYRYSTLAGKAAISEIYTPAAATIYTKLAAQLSQVYDITGGETPLIVTMARPVYDILLMSSEVQKVLDNSEIKQGDLDLRVKTLNGAVIIPVSSQRMKTAYTYNSDGEGGFTVADGAKDINWIICPKTAPIAVSKTDNVKIISPEANQFADAWDIDYRKYYDLLVSDNAAKTVAVCTKS